MHYTRRVGELEETFDGTPDEIIKVINSLDKSDDTSSKEIIISLNGNKKIAQCSSYRKVDLNH